MSRTKKWWIIWNWKLDVKSMDLSMNPHSAVLVHIFRFSKKRHAMPTECHICGTVQNKFGQTWIGVCAAICFWAQSRQSSTRRDSRWAPLRHFSNTYFEKVQKLTFEQKNPQFVPIVLMRLIDLPIPIDPVQKVRKMSSTCRKSLLVSIQTESHFIKIYVHFFNGRWLLLLHK